MISVTILTKNSEKHLKKVLDSVQNFPEIIIYDTGSNDQTLTIAKSYPNVKVFNHPFQGFGKTHNLASQKASFNWILSIDSDEVMSEELVKEIQNLNLNPSNVYSFPRKNFYDGKWIKGCGWYPDRVIRLYHRKMTSFSNDKVHEKVITNHLNIIPLKNPIYHYSYSSTDQFLEKMQHYSTLFAEQNKGRKKSSPSTAFFHALFTFFKSYILKKGILDGSQGFTISLYNANTAYYKYLKLYEINKNKEKED